MTNTTAVPDLPALSAQEAVHLLRLALVQAECAIKGREHTGFINRALVATEHIFGQPDTQPAPSGDAVEVLRDIAEVSDETSGVWRMAQAGIAAVSLATTSRAATVAKDGGEVVAHNERLLWCLRTVRAIADLGRSQPLGDWYPQAVMMCSTLKIVLGNTAEAIEAGTSATPKPEASAANQQAGRDRNMGLLDEALHWIENSTENAPSLCGDIRKALGLPVAAPISEGTGKGEATPLPRDAVKAIHSAVLAIKPNPAESKERQFVFNSAIHSAAAAVARFAFEEMPAAPAASNGDALPEVTDLGFVMMVKRSSIDEILAWGRKQREAGMLAARAGTGTGSAGEDHELHVILADMAAAVLHQTGEYSAIREKLVAYIDTRATKVEAAPGNAGEGVA